MNKPFLHASVALALTLAACGGADPSKATGGATTPAAAAAPATPDGWVDADLSTALKGKLPLIVKAPKGFTFGTGPIDGPELATEKVTFYVDDVTELGADFFKRAKEDVQKNSGMVFEKLVLDQPDGFIAQMGGGNYIPLRIVTVGGKKYQFTVRPLYALQSEEEAKQLYDLAAQAKAK